MPTIYPRTFANYQICISSINPSINHNVPRVGAPHAHPRPQPIHRSVLSINLSTCNICKCPIESCNRSINPSLHGQSIYQSISQSISSRSKIAVYLFAVESRRHPRGAHSPMSREPSGMFLASNFGVTCAGTDTYFIIIYFMFYVFFVFY